MNGSLTPNTQAILLLTAPLILGPRQQTPELLSLGEYNKLTRLLREKQRQPADLLNPEHAQLLQLCSEHFGSERVNSLLNRSFLLSQAVERWSSRAIWVVSRADHGYPRRLKSRLREDAPPIIYGCGKASLLDGGGLAVVGSRNITEELVCYTTKVGHLAAEAHRPIVSGGAKGIDRAAIAGALQAHGRAVAILADSLERAATAYENREVILDGRLVVISPFDPAAGFNVGNAMQRNKLIYALADAALVVTADFNKGGTWAGAIEQLDRFHLVPVFVRNGKDVGKGNSSLLQRGAVRWPEPRDAEALKLALSEAVQSKADEPKQESLSLILREQPAEPSAAAPAPREPARAEIEAQPHPASALKSAARLNSLVEELLRLELREAKTEDELSTLLGVNKAQIKVWLKYLLEQRTIAKEKKSKPARYRLIEPEKQLF